MNKELIELLKYQIKNDAKTNGDGDITSFQEGLGVLLTANEARECLAALEGREQVRALLIEQAMETCYRHKLPQMGSKTAARQYAVYNWPHYLTPKASEFLN